jgi:hypothetical protein
LGSGARQAPDSYAKTSPARKESRTAPSVPALRGASVQASALQVIRTSRHYASLPDAYGLLRNLQLAERSSFAEAQLPYGHSVQRELRDRLPEMLNCENWDASIGFKRDYADAGAHLVRYRDGTVHAYKLGPRFSQTVRELQCLDQRRLLVWQVVDPVVGHDASVDELEMVKWHRALARIYGGGSASSGMSASSIHPAQLHTLTSCSPSSQLKNPCWTRSIETAPQLHQQEAATEFQQALLLPFDTKIA